MSNKRQQEIKTEYDLGALSAPAVGRFRTDVEVLYQKARRMSWLLKCGAREINLEEVAELSAEVTKLSIGVETFARKRAG